MLNSTGAHRFKGAGFAWLVALLVWSGQVLQPLFACDTSGEFEPPLASDELFYRAYSPASGQERTTLFHIPATAPADDRILVILLHGGGDHDLEDMLSDMRRTGWADIARRSGIVLAYPTALKEPDTFGATFNWNDGRLGTDIWAMPDHQNIDDVGYLAEIMDIAQQQFFVGQRIYVMGISNGGMMAFRLASDRRTNGRIGAMAVMAAQIPAARAGEAMSAIPTLLISGSQDPLIPSEGGAVWSQLEDQNGQALGEPLYLGEVISHRATLGRLLRANGCNTDKKSGLLPNRSDDGTRVALSRYCGASGDVTSVRVIGGGHRWQGLGDNSQDSVHPCFAIPAGAYEITYYIDAGLTTLDGFNATDAAWRFFLRRQR